MISPFIDPITKEKIVFVPSNESEQRKSLSVDIDMTIVERSLGGDDELEFDSNVYLDGLFNTDYLGAVHEKMVREKEEHEKDVKKSKGFRLFGR